MNSELLAKAENLLKHNSKGYTLNKLISEMTSRQSVTSITKIVDKAEENLTKN